MTNFKNYYNESWAFDGMSALCIYGVYTKDKQGNKYPYDPDDLTRCFQCLRFITRNENLNDWQRIIKKVCEAYPESKEWDGIYHNFALLYQTYFDEYDSNCMPKTYQLMNEIIK